MYIVREIGELHGYSKIWAVSLWQFLNHISYAHWIPYVRKLLISPMLNTSSSPSSKFVSKLLTSSSNGNFNHFVSSLLLLLTCSWMCVASKLMSLYHYLPAIYMCMCSKLTEISGFVCVCVWTKWDEFIRKNKTNNVWTKKWAASHKRTTLTTTSKYASLSTMWMPAMHFDDASISPPIITKPPKFSK